jgi:predicted NBD/HSP70 family sugar kinase
MQIPPTSLACVEIGGGGIQTVVFSDGADPVVIDGAHQPNGAALAFAVPGLIVDGVVAEASNLGWRDIDPVDALGLDGPASLVVNDAEAAALGEYALRQPHAPQRLVYVCIGTGIGGAVVDGGRVLRSNLFGHNADGHGTHFGDRLCRCERTGCLETVAAGWALPEPLTDEHLRTIAMHLARAIDTHPLAQTGTVVVGGGIARRYRVLIGELTRCLPRRTVEPSRAPSDAKSAAAWGLRSALSEAM